MSTTILKFEATAFRPQDDDAPDCLAASISIPVEEDDEVIVSSRIVHLTLVTVSVFLISVFAYRKSVG